MSESQEIDHPRVWWKEAVKRRRVQRFDAALVGGRRHKAYLSKLGMPPDRIVLGYNAVGGAELAARAARLREAGVRPLGMPERPYFLSVSRFVPETNLTRLIRAYDDYRSRVHDAEAWGLVLCGGGPEGPRLTRIVEQTSCTEYVHFPGFLQAEALTHWYAFASSLVLPSLMEPWGLVVNEAAACGLPLLVSERAGCAETLVPGPTGTTGRRFDPLDEGGLADAMVWMSGMDGETRKAMGRRAAETVAGWGPERFAEGSLKAADLARASVRRRQARVISTGALIR